jgi:hypothetical protein
MGRVALVPEYLVVEILKAPPDMSSAALSRQFGIRNQEIVCDIRKGRTRRNVAPDLPRIDARTMRRTCADCKLFDPKPQEYDEESHKFIEGFRRCNIGIPECETDLNFARACSAFIDLTDVG